MVCVDGVVAWGNCLHCEWEAWQFESHRDTLRNFFLFSFLFFETVKKENFAGFRNALYWWCSEFATTRACSEFVMNLVCDQSQRALPLKINRSKPGLIITFVCSEFTASLIFTQVPSLQLLKNPSKLCLFLCALNLANENPSELCLLLS